MMATSMLSLTVLTALLGAAAVAAAAAPATIAALDGSFTATIGPRGIATLTPRGAAASQCRYCRSAAPPLTVIDFSRPMERDRRVRANSQLVGMS